MKKDEWILDDISISFQKGYDFKDNPEEEKHDRYEGTIKFKNGQKESFQFRVPPNMSQKYIDLIAADIVKSARGLGDRLIKSLGLEEMEKNDE